MMSSRLPVQVGYLQIRSVVAGMRTGAKQLLTASCGMPSDLLLDLYLSS